MAKFNFKMASILSIREKMEDLKKNEFGKAVKQLEIEKNRMVNLLLAEKNCIDSFRQKLQTGTYPEDVRMHNLYLKRLEFLKIKQQEMIDAAEIVVEERRLELVEAMRERKALEILKENQYEEFLMEEKQAEQKVVDEIVSYRGAKKSSS